MKLTEKNLRIVALGVITSIFCVPLRASPPHSFEFKSGRYQLVPVSQSVILLVDTQTGRCWSKPLGGKWRDEGTPVLENDGSVAERPKIPSSPDHNLPHQASELTVKQWECQPIPGLDEAVQIQLGDITKGQVLLSLVTKEGQELLPETSVQKNDLVTFLWEEKTYGIRVLELKNLLTGDDFATLSVSLATPGEKAAASRVQRFEEVDGVKEKTNQPKHTSVTVNKGETFETNVSGKVKVSQIKSSGFVEMEMEGVPYDFAVKEGDFVWLTPHEALKVASISEDRKSVNLVLAYPVKSPPPF